MKFNIFKKYFRKNIKKDNNIILTGVARSGTTLSTHLLNKLPNTVALHEPIVIEDLFDLKNQSIRIKFINKFFDYQRNQILKNRIAITKHAKGIVPDNPFGDVRNKDGLRQSMVTRGEINISKDLDNNFYLIVKHPAAFTGMLEDLIVSFPCYAIIRNPLSVLGSWNSANIPVQNGHAPAAENLDLNLKSRLQNVEEKIDRQLILLSWWFDKYLKYLPSHQIIKYEDIVESGGKALRVIVESAEHLNEDLKNKNVNLHYDNKVMQVLSEKLLKEDGSFWKFYSRDEVAELAESFGIVN